MGKTAQLELSPEQTLERIKKRSRECEDGIPIDYLTHLYNAYQVILKALEKRCKVVRVDARVSAEKVYDVVNKAIEETRLEIKSNGHPCYK